VTVLIESNQIRWFLEKSGGNYLKGDYQAQVRSDQMVLVQVRREAGPHDRQPEMLKKELKNKSRKPRNQVRKLP
jgi:hypothetical protein